MSGPEALTYLAIGLGIPALFFAVGAEISISETKTAAGVAVILGFLAVLHAIIATWWVVLR